MKICKGCDTKKENTQFYKDKTMKDGLRSKCKDCYKEASKTYYDGHIEKYRAKHAEYRKNHLKEEKAYTAEYYQNNKEVKKILSSKNYYENVDAIKLRHAEWNKNNPERLKELHRAKKKANPGKYASYTAKHRAKKLNQTPPNADFTLIEEFYKEARHLTDTTGNQYHVDHIKPLDKGGLHHQDNLQVITAEENLRKGNKY